VPLTVVVGRTVAVMVVSTIAVEAGVMAVSITVVDQVEVMVGVTTRVLVVVMLVRDTITVVAGAVFEEVKTE
jgi:glycerol-3-phosphate responsive antiterminator